ncbi:sensor histidine kinase [Paenibacillus sp. NPDC058071]|uniref:sensor histidine kinase n=1 Tax=Paenibacillus sp. NPDC058071 TaxID=3346326 RepID=UPI0036DB4FCE
MKWLQSVPWNSIRVKLVLGLLAITLPLIALLIYNNQYSVRVVHNQVANSNENLIQIHMKQIDAKLTEIERYLVGVRMADLNVQAISDNLHEDDYILTKTSISRKFNSDMTIYPYVEGIFLYSISRDDIVQSYRNTITYSEIIGSEEMIKGEVMKLANQSASSSGKWQVVSVGAKRNLLQIFGDGDIYVGAWIPASALVEPLRNAKSDASSTVLMVDGNGDMMYSTLPIVDETIDFTRSFDKYYLSGKNDSYLIVGEPSTKGAFTLVAAILNKSILENLPYLTWATMIVILLALLMLPVSFWLLRRVLILPLVRMAGTMRLIGQGSFNVRMEEVPSSDEFLLVNRTFNRMLSQIEELKIHVYEEQLSKQRTELRHLQLQINPHFFMNSLNILYNLAQMKQYSLIQEMTMSLSQYFRYMFQSQRSLALLKEELQHVIHYLHIQQMRFSNRLTYEIEVPEFLRTTSLPPLMLQTVVENTIKHAVKAEGSTMLTIEATLDDLAEEPMVCLTIRDNGAGFSDEALLAFQSNRVLIDDDGEHIGLWNIRERLRLQYGDKAWIECYNDDPHGAVTEIYVPLRTQ